jgi:hypothetical protein
VSNNGLLLFGFPVVVTDAVPKGEIVFGRFPTWQDVINYDSFGAAVEAQEDQWGIIAKIANVDTDGQ